MTGNIRKNDAAANRTAYYERQSTYSPDLPLRYVMYVADLLYARIMELDDAVERAITECIREGILSEFLQKNRAEAKKRYKTL